MKLLKKNVFQVAWDQVSDIVPRNSSILITGANGLIASDLVDTLMYFNKEYAINNRIIALCRNKERAQKRFTSFLDCPLFELEIQDIREFRMEQYVDYIVHAASNAHPRAYAMRPIETMQTNLLGTMRILNYASSEQCKKVVYVSTSEIYGEVPDGMDRFQETEFGCINTLNPRSCYSESKRCAETLCACYVKERGVDISVVRPGYVYGRQITEENSRADAQFLRRVLAKENIIMKSKGEQKRSYCYVMDAVTALLYVMVRGKTGEAYNIANSNSEATIKQFAETMAQIGDVSVEFDLPSEEERSGYSVIKNSLLDDGKLKKLGWKASYDLKQGLTAAIKG